MNVSSRTLNKVDIFCKLNSQCSFYVGIISVENLCIIEQNNGSEVCNVIDSVISKAFKFHAKGEYFLEKISYNSFIFVIIDENLKSTIGVIENIINFINKRDNFLKMKNVFFLIRIGLAEHTNLKDLNITHSQAQTALFECSSEKKIYSFYRTSLNTIQKHINNTDLLANYLEAYENRKLEFDFQPIVDSKTRKYLFYECLLRLVDEKGLRLSGSSHIQAAEQYGLVSFIDQYTLIRVLKLLEQDKNLILHINISGATITDYDWIELAQQLFYKKDFHHRLVVEITETSVIKNLKAANFFIDMLRKLGCKISIDDFGSGYSSFAQLKNMNVDSIKIGEDYIKDLPDNRDNAIFIETLIKLAKNQNLEIIAEHVENEKAAKYLADIGVEYLQGYLFS